MCNIPHHAAACSVFTHAPKRSILLLDRPFVPPFLKPSSKRKEMGNGAVVEIQGKKEGLGLAGQRADSQTSLIVSTSIFWKGLYTGLLVA